MRIAVVTGNPKPASRTQNVALAVADALAAASEPEKPPAHLVVDLAEHASSLFDWSDAELNRLTAEVAAADIAIFASPTYKAAYTGMLKAFLDRYGGNGEVTALAVVPTGSPSASTEVTTVTPVAKCPIASRNSATGTPVDSCSGNENMSLARGDNRRGHLDGRRIRGHGEPPVS